MTVTSILKRAASEEPEHHEAVQQPMDMKRVKVPCATGLLKTAGEDSTTEPDREETEVIQEEHNEVAVQSGVDDIPTTKMNSGSPDVQPEETTKTSDTGALVAVDEQIVVEIVQPPNGGDIALPEGHLQGTAEVDAIGAETVPPINHQVTISNDDSEAFSKEGQREEEPSEKEYDHGPYGNELVDVADQSAADLHAAWNLDHDERHERDENDLYLEAISMAHEDKATDTTSTNTIHHEIDIAGGFDESESNFETKQATGEELVNSDVWDDNSDYGSDF